MTQAIDSIFHSPGYLRITQRRLEHLASLGLPLVDRTVLDVGAGIGDFSSFYLDRGCRVLAVEPREENLRDFNTNMRRSGIQFEGKLELRAGDVWALNEIEGVFDIVHAYGVLYHLSDPARALRTLASRCGGILLLETCVSNQTNGQSNVVPEPTENASQAIDGLGCRPDRAWLHAELKQLFAHVYMPQTQPCHEQFPRDWRVGFGSDTLQRSIYVASRQPLPLPSLRDELIRLYDL